jgi:hypothetical protein
MLTGALGMPGKSSNTAEIAQTLALFTDFVEK